MAECRRTFSAVPASVFAVDDRTRHHVLQADPGCQPEQQVSGHRAHASRSRLSPLASRLSSLASCLSPLFSLLSPSARVGKECDCDGAACSWARGVVGGRYHPIGFDSVLISCLQPCVIAHHFWSPPHAPSQSSPLCLPTFTVPAQVCSITSPALVCSVQPSTTVHQRWSPPHTLSQFDRLYLPIVTVPTQAFPGAVAGAALSFFFSSLRCKEAELFCRLHSHLHLHCTSSHAGTRAPTGLKVEPFAAAPAAAAVSVLRNASWPSRVPHRMRFAASSPPCTTSGVRRRLPMTERRIRTGR